MKVFNKYLIKTTDQFNPEYFSSINEEISAINLQIEHLPEAFKPEIIVSYLKDHLIENNWKNANPELVALVTSGSLFTGSIESLFDSCRNNPVFRQGLEAYLNKRFAVYVHS